MRGRSRTQDRRSRDRHRPRCHYHRDGTAKTAYATEDTAIGIIRKYRLEEKGYTAYECPTCHKWHIGHYGRPQRPIPHDETE